MGRESKLTDEVQSAVVEALRAGVELDVAAGYAKIDRSTIRRWMELGRDDQDCVPKGDKGHQPGQCETADHPAGECPELARYRDFRAAITHADHILHVKLAGEMVRASARDWKAGLELARRRWPRTWNIPAVTALEGGLQVEVTLTARDRVRSKLEALAARGELALPQPSADDAEALDSEEERDEPERPAPKRSRARGDAIDTTARESKPRVVVA